MSHELDHDAAIATTTLQRTLRSINSVFRAPLFAVPMFTEL